MKNKLFLTILLGLFLVGNVCALTSMGIYKQGTTINITQICDDATYITLTSVTYPNSSIAIGQVNMTSAGNGEFYYQFTNTSTMGRYDVRGVSNGCDESGNNFATYFEVNYSGEELSTGSSVFYTILIFLMLFLLIGCLYGAGKLPAMNEKDEEGRIMSVKWLKYLKHPLYFVSWMLFIAILYISSNLAFAYLTEQLFAKVLFVLFRICFGLTLPIVAVWLVWFFVMFFQDKQFQKMINRGLFPQTKRF